MSTEGKILSREAATALAERLKKEGKKIVTVNGSFDLFHAGHVYQLEEAAAQGDALFVGVNSDVSVRAYKRADRPILPEQARARILAALECVTAVVILHETEAGAAIIELVKPQVHANGAEYGAPETWVEYPAIQKYGVQGYSVSRQPGLSTTEIIEKIRR